MKELLLTKDFIALVDDEDYDRIVSVGEWHTHCAGHTNYARSGKNGYLHRFIMNPPKGKVVDHIDHNGLNNQKSNLCVCSYSENQKNVQPYKKLAARNIFGFK